MKPGEELYVGIVGKYAIFMKEDMFFSTMLFSGHYLEASTILEKVRPVYEATADAKALYDLIDNISAVFAAGDDRCINVRLTSYTSMRSLAKNIRR